MAGSLGCGLSGSVAVLICFRVVQGIGGGMIMPAGQAILARAAGPQRMGRVMALTPALPSNAPADARRGP